MIAELKAKWLKALRSGRYTQGRNWLRRNNTFCCLGVLCDISGTGTWEKDAENYEACPYRTSHGSSHTMLPYPLTDEFPYNQQKMLTDLNDNGESFNVIADWIEGNIETDKL